MICKKCGASVPDNTYECPFCGTQIGKVMPSEPEEQAPAAEEAAAAAAGTEEVFDENAQKRREQIQKMMDEKQQQLDEIQKRREAKRKKQQRTKAAIIAATCLAVGGAAYGVTYYVSNHGGEVTVEETASPEATVDPGAAIDPNATPEAAEATELPSTEPLSSAAPASSNATGSAAGSTGTSSGSSWSATGNTGSGTSSRTGSSGSSSSSGTVSRTGSSSGSGSGSGSAGSSSGGSSTGGSSSNSSSGSGISSSGVIRTNLNSLMAKGGEVIYDNNSGRYIMTFISNGKEYYAYVSEGSTTDQIYGKNMTVTASPTGGTFRGSTVFDITSLTTYDGDYILKNSGTQLLTESDISGMSKADIALARNEIFARHGRPFTTPEYKQYFEGKSWYRVDPNYNLNDDMSNLNDIEQKNVNFLLLHEI